MTLGWRPAVLVAGGIASAGFKAGALTGRAALAATGVGAAILRGGGPPGGALLAAFYVSGSALPRLFPSARRFQSDAARDERQVLANGGAAAAVALLGPLIGESRALAGMAGSLAAATADTWATEIGSTSPRPPRLILSGAPVRPGLSGGVTPRGSAGAVAGALFIAALAGLLARSPRLALPVALAGCGGAFIDSVLGELVQAKYRDAATGAVVEEPGPETGSLVAGSRLVDNDVVNLACTLSGATLALLAFEGIHRRRP